MAQSLKRWMNGRWCASAALAMLSVLTGCATGPGPVVSEPGTQIDMCRRWFADLDALVARAGVNDAQDRRIEGFPQLRQSRFVASFRDRARQSDAAFDAWFSKMRGLGEQGIAVEIANVPEASWAERGLAGVDDARVQAMAKTRACADVLSRHDRSQRVRRENLLTQPGVLDDYSAWARVLGMYAITRVPFSAGVHRWQEETKAGFSARIEPKTGILERYVPEPSTVDEVADVVARAPRDALGIPVLSAALSQRLLDRHSPLLEVVTEGAFDRIGEMGMRTDASPTVDSTKPVVYRRIAFARHGEATLVQLVYLYWFPERPKSGPLDLLGGALDGLMWRVTLDERGQPLVYDSAHACGCYHLFFPTQGLRPTPPPETGMEWAFVPAQAPLVGPGERVILGVAARTHYLSAVSSTADFTGTPYKSRDAARLRSLPLNTQEGAGNGSRWRSLYGPDGIVPGSQRGERYVFWPMGVRDAGAQRQWGHHATAFVGRRHFDDPDLIERRFERTSDVPGQAPGLPRQ